MILESQQLIYALRGRTKIVLLAVTWRLQKDGWPMRRKNDDRDFRDLLFSLGSLIKKKPVDEQFYLIFILVESGDFKIICFQTVNF